MEKMIKIKEKLLKKCTEVVGIKYETVTKIMASNKKALESETKSSAGDKHETGRAMLQLEMEKASQQFASISLMQEVLQKIEIHKKNEIGKLGSLIYTNQGNYFLAVSIGQITINEDNYFVISPSSPIGKLLLGKKKGDDFRFNSKEFKIKEIV